MKRYAKVIAVAAALVMCSALSAQSITPRDPARIVAYLFEVFGGREALVQATLNEASAEPELRTIAEAALASFDIESLAAEFSSPLSQALPANESGQCLVFIESTDGAALLAAGQKAGSQQELLRQLESLPSQEQSAVLEFFNSSCFKKTIGFLGSQEASQISRRYGKSLVCRYAERTNPDMLGVLRSHGECHARPAG